MENQLFLAYQVLREKIQERLREFESLEESEYFYEICYCLLTPQSKAKNALKVVELLKERDFQNSPFDCAAILRHPTHYIRFHNSKSKRLAAASSSFPAVLEIIKSDSNNFQKRNAIAEIVNGFGLKESSHFLRNIGFKNLAIIDRHILKQLLKYGVIESIPKSISKKAYFNIEEKFLSFAERVKIPMDELDLLFWASETEEILK